MRGSSPGAVPPHAGESQTDAHNEFGSAPLGDVFDAVPRGGALLAKVRPRQASLAAMAPADRVSGVYRLRDHADDAASLHFLVTRLGKVVQPDARTNLLPYDSEFFRPPRPAPRGTTEEAGSDDDTSAESHSALDHHDRSGGAPPDRGQRERSEQDARQTAHDQPSERHAAQAACERSSIVIEFETRVHDDGHFESLTDAQRASGHVLIDTLQPGANLAPPSTMPTPASRPSAAGSLVGSSARSMDDQPEPAWPLLELLLHPPPVAVVSSAILVIGILAYALSSLSLTRGPAPTGAYGSSFSQADAQPAPAPADRPRRGRRGSSSIDDAD